MKLAFCYLRIKNGRSSVARIKSKIGLFLFWHEYLYLLKWRSQLYFLEQDHRFITLNIKNINKFRIVYPDPELGQYNQVSGLMLKMKV